MSARTGKHTPGPWTVEGTGIKALVRGDDSTIVALRHRLPGVVHDANARLIAAAPDMLEALQTLLYGVDCELDSENRSVFRYTQKELAPARAAIAKALGNE